MVTESFKADALSLPIIFKQIQNILGVFPASSIIVLGTKKNACDKFTIEKRTKSIRETLKTFGVPIKNYMDFYTPCP
jgi:hypothetical protein